MGGLARPEPRRIQRHLDANLQESVNAQSITLAEALDVALCYGWIDGQRKSHDEQSFLQKYTPRRPRSAWSKINTGHIERLTAEGRMRPAGLAQVEAAKRDGRWDAAYDSPANIAVPEDFLKALERTRRRKRSSRRSTGRTHTPSPTALQSAKKPETRERRLKEFIDNAGARREAVLRAVSYWLFAVSSRPSRLRAARSARRCASSASRAAGRCRSRPSRRTARRGGSRCTSSR